VKEPAFTRTAFIPFFSIEAGISVLLSPLLLLLLLLGVSSSFLHPTTLMSAVAARIAAAFLKYFFFMFSLKSFYFLTLPKFTACVVRVFNKV